MKIIETVEANIDLNEILSILNVYEFAISKGYNVSELDMEILGDLLSIKFIEEHRKCYPVLFGLRE